MDNVAPRLKKVLIAYQHFIVLRNSNDSLLVFSDFESRLRGRFLTTLTKLCQLSTTYLLGLTLVKEFLN
jgi:hypothetical protein